MRSKEEIKLFGFWIAVLCAYLGLSSSEAWANLGQTFGDKSIYSLNKVSEASDDAISVSLYKDGVFETVNYKLSLNKTMFGDEQGDTEVVKNIKLLPDYDVNIGVKYSTSLLKGKYAATSTAKDVEGHFVGLNVPYLSGNYAVGSAIYNWGKKYGITTIDGVFIDNYVENYNKALVWGGAVSLRTAETVEVSGDFVGNFTKTLGEGTGGAIALAGQTVGTIKGNFIGNNAFSETSTASAGAIEVNWDMKVQNIEADFVANFAEGGGIAKGGAIGILGFVDKIKGDFVGNYAKSINKDAKGGAVMVYYENRSNMKTVPSFAQVEGNFIKNSAIGGNWAHGGAMHIEGLGGKVSGDFIGNNALSANGNAGGGAISISDSELIVQEISYDSHLGDVVGNFIDNMAEGKTFAQGGAIEAFGNLLSVKGGFYGNKVKSSDGEAKGGAIYMEGSLENGIEADFVGNYALSETGLAKGGAVWTTKDMKFVADARDMVIYDNYTMSNGVRDDNAFWVDNESVKLDFELKNGGSLLIGDNFDGVKGYDINIWGDNNNTVYLFNDLRKADVKFSNVKIDMADDMARIYKVNSFNLDGNIDFVGNVDFGKEIIDSFRAEEGYVVKDGAKLNVIDLRWLNEPKKDLTSILFAEKELKDSVMYKGIKKIITPVYVYDIEYKNKENGGYFEFYRGSKSKGLSGYNPTVIGSGISANVGATGVVSQTVNYSFQNLENYMNVPFSERVLLVYNLGRNCGLSMSSGEPLPSFMKENKASVWMKPFMIDEDVVLKNGAEISNKAYGTLVGFDTGVRKVNSNWDGAFTGYIGHSGATQKYEGVNSHQNGGLIGGTLSLYKGDFFSALTLSVGALETESKSVFGKDEYNTLLGGVGSKTGYNFEFKDGRFIIQPSLLLAYSYIDTEDYKNVLGVKIENKAAHSVQISPGVRFITNLDNGWKPYFEVSKVWNVGDEGETIVEGARLPRMNVKPYMQYGIGVQGCVKDKFMLYGQGLIEEGGRDGVLITGGVRWLF